MSTLKAIKTAKSTKIFKEIQDILKYNIEIIEAISSNKIISLLKAKRNKIMQEYINILKRGKNA